MSFTKRDVKDRVVQYPRRYKLVEVSDGIYDLIPVTGIVTEEGTPINKAYLQPIEDGLDNALEILLEKAPKSHASSGTTYGLGTAANYGHVKTINNLTQASHVDGTALSAYQGKVLFDLINDKLAVIDGTYTGDNASSRVIAVGKTPRLVILVSRWNSLDATVSVTSVNYPSYYSTDKFCEIITNGFRVYQTGSSAFGNRQDTIYRWFVFY